MGLDVSSVGNHEFDEGITELLRMQNGGCHPTTAASSRTPPATTSSSPAPTSSTSPPTSSTSTTGKTVFPAVLDQEGRRGQDRLHRHDAGGHRHWSSPSGVAGSTSRTRSRPATPRPDPAEEAGRQGHRRAACTRAASRPPPYSGCTGHLRPDRRHRQAPRAEDRRGRHRPHAPAVRLQHPGPDGQPAPPGHQRGRLRPRVTESELKSSTAHDGEVDRDRSTATTSW